MSSTEKVAARDMLHLPETFEIPDGDAIVDDARAILLHAFSLRKELAESGLVVSPIWERQGSEASVRAAVVPPEVVRRHFEGPGVASLRDAGVTNDILAVFREGHRAFRLLTVQFDHALDGAYTLEGFLKCTLGNAVLFGLGFYALQPCIKVTLCGGLRRGHCCGT